MFSVAEVLFAAVTDGSEPAALPFVKPHFITMFFIDTCLNYLKLKKFNCVEYTIYIKNGSPQTG